MAKASERATKLYFQCAREQMAPYHIVMHTFSISVEDSQALAQSFARAHPRPQRLHDVVGQRFVADWGRHCARAGHPDTPPRRDYRVRYRSTRRSGNVEAGARHGGDRSATGCWNAYALSRLCTCAKQGNSYLMLLEHWDQALRLRAIIGPSTAKKAGHDRRRSGRTIGSLGRRPL